LGVTFQQVYKYEQGKTRISAGRIYAFGKVLSVPITFFFEGITDRSSAAAPISNGSHIDSLGRREAIELFAAYRAISNPKVRLRLRELARALGSEPNGSTEKRTAPRPPSRDRTDRGRGATKR